MAIDFSNEVVQDFIVEASELFEHLCELIENANGVFDKKTINALFRDYHTIKGGASFLSITAVVELCHALEGLFDLLRSNQLTMDQDRLELIYEGNLSLDKMFKNLRAEIEPEFCSDHTIIQINRLVKQSNVDVAVNEEDVDWSQFQYDDLISAIQNDEIDADALLTADDNKGLTESDDDEIQSVSSDDLKVEGSLSYTKKEQLRVNAEHVDQIMMLVGELVLIRNRFRSLDTLMADPVVVQLISNLDWVAVELQTQMMSMRMQPIKQLFNRFPMLVSELSKKLGKKVRVVLTGDETALDKRIIDALSDPLTHLVRNALDHGIEDEQSRIAAGKEPTGELTLAASQQGDNLLLTMTDDGRGLDEEMIKNKAITKGIITKDKADFLTTKQIYQLVFHPGFSTRDEASDLSGRGVGMDVVLHTIESLKGQISLHSTLGVGTKIEMKIPLTLVILPCLLFSVDKQFYAFPASYVDEIIKINEEQIEMLDGYPTVYVRDQTIPVMNLSRAFRADGGACREYFCIVTFINQSYFGFLVDSVKGQEESVIKHLSSKLDYISHLAGVTITGKGEVAQLLDIPALMKKMERDYV